MSLCLYACIHAYMHVYMPTRMSLRLYACIYAYTHVCIHVCMHVYMHLYMQGDTRVYTCVFTHVYMHVYMHANSHYTCVYMHVYTHVYAMSINASLHMSVHKPTRVSICGGSIHVLVHVYMPPVDGRRLVRPNCIALFESATHCSHPPLRRTSCPEDIMMWAGIYHPTPISTHPCHRHTALCPHTHVLTDRSAPLLCNREVSPTFV